MVMKLDSGEPSPLSDNELLDAIKKNDSSGLEVLFHRYGPCLFEMICRLEKLRLKTFEVSDPSTRILEQVFINFWNERNRLANDIRVADKLFSDAYYLCERLTDEKS